MEQNKVRKERKSTDLTQKELTLLRDSTKLSEKDDKTNSSSEAFDSIDKNNDGTIDFNEFLFFVAVSSRNANLEERLEFIFDLWDVSNDGQIDQNELAHLISAVYDRTGVKDRQGEKNPVKRAKAILTKLDLSGDRKLNKQEFINGIKNDQALAELLASDK